MASITSLGLSGLPLSDLLEDLRKVEEAPLKLLENRKLGFETKISGYGILKSSVSSLGTAVTSLGEMATFHALKTTSSNTTAMTASIPSDSIAVAGSYQIEVESLATTQSLASKGQDSRTDALSSSDVTLKFTIGDDVKEITVKAADTSLEGIRTAINKAGIGVSATLLNNGGDTGAHQLVFSTTKTGVDASVTKIEVVGSKPGAKGEDLASILSYEQKEGVTVSEDNDDKPQGVTETNPATDAKLSVNGIDITSGSNTITDAIEGVTLNLLALTEDDKPLTLKVEENTAVASSAVNAFVSAYNSLNSAIKQLTSYDAAEQVSSALTGDRVPRTVQAQLRSVLGSLTGEGGIQMLSQMGIKTNTTTGALEVDAAKLADTLKESKNDVVAFFTGENGLAKKLTTAIDDMLASNGVITNATTGMEESIKAIEKQHESLTARIDGTMSRYQKQFVQLETLMSQMNSTSSYLTTQMEMLESMASNKKK